MPDLPKNTPVAVSVSPYSVAADEGRSDCPQSVGFGIMRRPEELAGVQLARARSVSARSLAASLSTSRALASPAFSIQSLRKASLVIQKCAVLLEFIERPRSFRIIRWRSYWVRR